MAASCELVKQQIGGLYHCEQLGDYTRVQTPMLFPDGDFIDIYIKSLPNGFLLTDLGETVRWLKSQTINSKRTNKQIQMVTDICKTVGVDFFRGMISINTNDSSQLAAKLVDITQASLRVADISMMFRSRLNEFFAEEVEEFLIEHQYTFDRDPVKIGRSQKSWKPNFHVRYNNNNSLVYTLSSGNRSVATAIVNKVCTAWMDLTLLRSPNSNIKFISLIDDNDDVWSESDIRLLSSNSEVAYWRRPDEFQDLLKSA